MYKWLLTLFYFVDPTYGTGGCPLWQPEVRKEAT